MSETATVPDVTPDSSPAPVDGSEFLSSLSPSDRASWRATGEIPATSTETEIAESSPAKPAEQATPPDGDVKAADPAKPAKRGGEARKEQLAAEIQDLLAQRAKLREDVRTNPATTPAPPASAAPPTDPEPTEDQFDNYRDFVKAQAKWEIREELRTQREQARAAEYQAAVEGMVKAAVERVSQYEATDPDFASKVDPRLLAIRPVSRLEEHETVAAENVIAEEVLKSDLTPQLLMHFTAHPDEFRAMTQMTPAAMLRAFGRLESRLDAPPSTRAVETPKKTVSAAPDPPPTLGTRATSAADDVEAAVARGDFTAYRAAQNKRDLAATR